MKRIAVLALLALVLPITAVAKSVDFSNSGGTLTGSTAGLTLAGSELIGINGLGTGGGATGSLGSVTFSTGSMISMSATGATFNAGGSFIITGNGTNGIPNGVIFNGSFSGTVTLTLVSATAAGDIYSLTGAISGTWYNGTTVSGATSQIYLFTGKNGWMGTSTVGSGDTIISTVPEPGTLGLLGTGLVGLAGVIRRKFRA